MYYLNASFVLVLLFFSNITHASFDWGGSGGNCSGSGNFQQQIKSNDVVDVGEIPSGKEGVSIQLTSDNDVDIQLYDKSTGDKIIVWPDGILSKESQQTTNYKGMNIEWSGYNGDGINYGHEYINISDVTNRTLVMKAFGYQAGFANVDYSWTGTQGCSEDGRNAENGSGTFQQQILHQAVVTVGDIPVGIDNLSIQLISDKDVDIQLYDKDNGVEIIAWPNGILNGSSKQTTNYKGMNIEWSGYNGDGSGLGHEYIKISGTTTQNLTMKAFGYQAGYATVNYSWGGGDNSTPSPFFRLENVVRKNIQGTSYSQKIISPFYEDRILVALPSGVNTFSSDASFTQYSNITHQSARDIAFRSGSHKYNGQSASDIFITGEGIKAYRYFVDNPYTFSLSGTFEGPYKTIRAHFLRNKAPTTLIAMGYNGSLVAYYDIQNDVSSTHPNATNNKFYDFGVDGDQGDLLDKYGRSTIWAGKGNTLATIRIPDYESGVTGGSSAPWFGNKITLLNEYKTQGTIVKLHQVDNYLYVLQKEGYLSIFDVSSDIPVFAKQINLQDFKPAMTEWNGLDRLKSEIGNVLLIGGRGGLIALSIKDPITPLNIDIDTNNQAICLDIYGVSSSYNDKSPVYWACGSDVVRTDFIFNP